MIIVVNDDMYCFYCWQPHFLFHWWAFEGKTETMRIYATVLYSTNAIIMFFIWWCIQCLYEQMAIL